MFAVTWERVTWCVLYSCLSLLIIIGNSLSIAVFVKSSRLRRMRTSILLINLAFADLLVGAVAVPMYMVILWPLRTLAENPTFKSSYMAIDLLAGFASLFSLSFVGLERMSSVFWPHRHRVTGKQPYFAAVVTCWLLSSVQVLLRILSEHKIVEFEVYFYTIMFSLSSVLVVMLAAYIAVWYKMRARQNELHGRHRRYSRISAEHEQKLVLTLSIVTGGFFITWLPFHFLNIAVFFCVPCQQKLKLNLILAIKLLQYSNSFMNLIIYSFRFPEFRRTLCRICGRHLRIVPSQSNVIGHQSSLKTNNQSPQEIESVGKDFLANLCEVADKDLNFNKNSTKQ
ncbi:adenosine receptor A1-like [Montipora foliosa]|uniref:adenosine receptor A1-like n=1 Tax=Montipora foliosa TaxID=591990 RepID=UPI0035F16CED